MKQGGLFFKMPNGISIPGVGSMRFSNFSKNLSAISNWIMMFGKQANSFLFYSLILGVTAVKEDFCQEPNKGSFNDMYLNYTELNGSLWVKYKYLFNVAIPNNTCNFSIAEKQPGNYNFTGCACLSKTNISTTANAFLYAQNLTEVAIQCIENYLKKCQPSSDQIYQIVIIYGLAIAIPLGIAALAIYFKVNPIYFKVNHRSEETKILLNSRVIPEAIRFNPIIDEEDQYLPEPPQNSGLCCFRR